MTQRTHYLKLLTESERDEVLRMATEFFHASPYAKYGVDPTEINTLISTFMDNPADKTCLVLMVDERPVGVLAAIAAKNIFNQFKVCGELIWWIDPAYRTFAYAGKMLDYYEYWAKEVVKAQLIQMVCLDEKLHNLYTRRGYSRAELAYTKEVT